MLGSFKTRMTLPEAVPLAVPLAVPQVSAMMGTCARCRRPFQRPAEATPLSAQWHRCPSCAGFQVRDVSCCALQ